MSFSAGHLGEDIRNDCFVELTPDRSKLEIESSVKPIYGRQIESEVRSSLQLLGLEGVGARVVDSGAFSWCIRARFEAAAIKYLASVGKPSSPMKLESRMKTNGTNTHHRRTRLYLPANTPKYFINAHLHSPDAVILDLEDAVPHAEKDDARSLVRHALASVDFGNCERTVRINPGDEGVRDLQFLTYSGVETVLLPKTEDAAQIEKLETKLAIIALIESAKGLVNANEIAAAPGVVAIAIGLEDYLADVGAGREAMQYAYGQIVNAARAHGVQPLASVYADIDDREGFFQEVQYLVSLGFEGVGCLHPSQIPIALRAMSPTQAQIESAQRVVEAFEVTGGATAVDGKMVDAPVAARARKVLEKAETGLPNWRII